MNDRPIAKIEEAFGWRGFPDALFYQSEHALRFELAGDVEEGALRLVRAMERARAVVDEVFTGSESLTAIVSQYDGERRTSRGAAAFKTLTKIGFRASFGRPDRAFQGDENYIAQFGEDLCRYWYASDFQKTDDSLAALIWAALGAELPIAPKARWIGSIYIVDFERKIVVWPYDDRGLDVLAPNGSILRPLYHRLNGWLLDYDREAMDAKFR
jgi:hypothetical protein